MTTLRYQAFTALLATVLATGLLATGPIASRAAEQAAGSAAGQGAGGQLPSQADQRVPAASPDRQAGNQDQGVPPSAPNQGPTQEQPPQSGPNQPVPGPTQGGPTQNNPVVPPVAGPTLPQDQNQAGGGNKVVQGPKDQTPKDPYKLDPGKVPAKESAKDFAKDLSKGPAKDVVKQPDKDIGRDVAKDLAGLPKAPNLPKAGDQMPVSKVQDLAKPQSFGSLNTLKSLDQLFANSRGGDQQATAVLVTGGAGNPVAGGKGGGAPNQDMKPNALPQGPGTPGTSPLAPATQGVQAVTVTPGSLGGLQSVLNARTGAGNTQLEMLQLQNKTNALNKATQDQSNTVKNLGDTARGTIQTIK